MSGESPTVPDTANERGVALWMVAASLVMILGMAAMAIDLGNLYVVRNQAQGAADAAALAGAQAIANSGFTSGLVTQATASSLAIAQAIAVGSQNLVGGASAQIQTPDVTVDFSQASDPRVTVMVNRTAARGNAMPTFFAAALGIHQADVTAQATAEAFNPSFGGPATAAPCIKPWLIPNCDETRTVPSPLDANCNFGGNQKFDSFINPTTGAILHPVSFTQGGAIGETLSFTPVTPAGISGPGDFYPLALGNGSYLTNIEHCNPVPLTCGSAVRTLAGNQANPTMSGVEFLIHARGMGLGQGQDSVNNLVNPPFLITAGPSNPYAPPGSSIVSSDSIDSFPLYDAHPMRPGGQSGTIIGFMQLFISGVQQNGVLTGVVLNIAGCGTGRSGANAVEGTEPVAVRLVE